MFGWPRMRFAGAPISILCVGVLPLMGVDPEAVYNLMKSEKLPSWKTAACCIP